MEESTKPITRAIVELKDNLSEVARVSEWSKLMGYKSTQKFTYHFIKCYGDRPHKYLVYVRLESIVHELRQNCKSNLQIAQDHSLPEERALNNFTNYYLHLSPTRIKELPNTKIEKILFKIRNNLYE